MATNDFKPVANDPISVVTSQAAWDVSSTRVNGFPVGTVDRAAFNKALRQSSVIAAALAQVAADTGLNMLDNGDQATIVNNLKSLLGLIGLKAGGVQAMLSATRLWTWQRDSTPVYSTPLVLIPLVIRAGGVIGGAITYNGPAILFGGYDGYVYCLNAITGAELWRTQVGGGIYGRVQAVDMNADTLLEIVSADQQGRIFILRCDGSVLTSGLTNRSLNSAYVRDGGRSLAGDAFTAYLTATAGGANWIECSGATYCDKAFMRTTPASGPIHDQVELLAPDGVTVTETKLISDVVGSGNHRITVQSNWASTPSAGTKFRIKNDHVSDFFFMHAGTISIEAGVPYMYQTGFDHHLVKFKLSDQTVVWKVALGGDTELFPAVLDVDGDSNLEVVMVSFGGILTTAGKENAHVSCWNASTGALKWATETPTGSVSSMLVAQVDGTTAWSVLVGLQNGQVVKLRGTDGVILEESTTFSDYSWSGVDSVPVKLPMVGGTHDLFVGNDAGYLTRVSSSLEVKWQQRVDGVFNSSPILADVDGDGTPEIIVGDMSGAVYVLNLAGAIVGAIFTKGGVEATPVAIDLDADGMIEIIIPTLLGRVECWRLTAS